jgi:hypothetical protein
VLTSSVGQTFGNLAGWNGMDVTPSILQGTNSNERIGNSLKLSGMSFPIQFTGQQYCMAARKLKVMLFRIHDPNNNTTVTEVINDYLDNNPLNGMRDMGSPRAYRNGKHDGITLIRSKVYDLPAPTMADGGSGPTTLQGYEAAGFTCKFNVKLKDILRYQNSGSTDPDGTRYFLFIMCDKGNHEPSITTTAFDVPVTTPHTGVSFRVSQRAWWVDN